MFMCCAFVGPDNKLYKMHGTYIKVYVFLRHMSWCIVKWKNQFYFVLLLHSKFIYIYIYATAQHCIAVHSPPGVSEIVVRETISRIYMLLTYAALITWLYPCE